jgi:acyl-CoA synthetase (NDP forming)
MAATGLDPNGLRPLFEPRSVAIVGASNDPNKIGGRPLAFLKRSGFAGALHPINPGAAEVQGVRAHRSLAEAPGEVEHAIIALPAPAVADALAECAAKGVKAVQVFAAGFGEADDAGRRAQAALAERARAAGMRLLGPNSLGLFSVACGFFGTFATALDGAWPRAGGIGFATQSGAFGSYAYALAQARGLGFSRFVATGNEADVDVAECIAFLAQDPATTVIVATFEGCKDGRKLIAALEAARTARKPVVVMKAGASEAGAAAAATHTGSLAGADAVYDAVLRQCNAWRARSLEELVDVAYLAAKGRLPASRRLGVVTTSGGIGALVADCATARGLELPAIGPDGAARVKALLPYAGASNPLDTSAALINDLSLYADALGILLEATQVGAVLGYLAHVGRNARHFGQLREPLFALKRAHPDKLFVLCMVSTEAVRAELEAEGFALFEDPARAVGAIAGAAAIAAGFDRADDPVPSAPRAVLPAGRLHEAAAKGVLVHAGVPVLPERLVASADAAHAAAAELGTPVAIKVVSADLPHKSDVGGVKLGVASAADAARAYDEVVANVRRARPEAKIDGVLVAPMLAGGVETILGVARDPVFGPVVMFGLGGVYVEVLKDVAFRAAPFGEAAARAMIAETLAAKFLAGVRGAPPADVAALAQTLARLAAFAHENRDLVEAIDVNPYVALPRGGYALDALVVPRKEES